MANLPTPDKLSGGLNISKSDAVMFSNERAGDILLYANHSNQRFIMGTCNADAIVTFTNEAVHMHRDVFCPNFIQSYGVTLTMGDPITRQHIDIIDSTGNATEDARAASNAIFSTSRVTYDPTDPTVPIGATEVLPTTYTSNVNMLGDLDVQGTLSVHDLTYHYSNVIIHDTETTRNSLFVEGSITTEMSVTVGSNANPNYPLMVQRSATSAMSNISIYAQGAIFAGGDIYGSSDSRFKTDLMPITNALSKLDSIGGYTFRRIPDGADAPRRAGVLAQDVESVLPEAVSTDSEGMRHVAYGNLSALLIEAIKELKTAQIRQHVLTVATTAADEAFEVALPASTARWTHALIAPAFQTPFSRASAFIADTGDSNGGQVAVGRCEAPGEYTVLVLQQ